MKHHVIFIVMTVLGLVGCTGEKRTYWLSVTNKAYHPITIGQVKDGPPYEDMWAKPEELAIRKARAGDQLWGVVVPPGKTASAGPIIGIFGPTDSAWLRVYAGEPSFSELLSMSRGHPNRLDLRMYPGDNAFVVTEERGSLVAKREAAQSQMKIE
jgi:hypothetical protein